MISGGRGGDLRRRGRGGRVSRCDGRVGGALGGDVALNGDGELGEVAVAELAGALSYSFVTRCAAAPDGCPPSPTVTKRRARLRATGCVHRLSVPSRRVVALVLALPGRHPISRALSEPQIVAQR